MPIQDGRHLPHCSPGNHNGNREQLLSSAACDRFGEKCQKPIPLLPIPQNCFILESAVHLVKPSFMLAAERSLLRGGTMNFFSPQSGFIFNIHALPPLLTAIAILVLGLVVVIREKGSRVSLLYFSYTLAASGWMFSAAFALFLTSEEWIYHWMKIANAGVTMIPAALYHFTVVVLDNERQHRRLVALAWVASFFFMVVTLFTDAMFGGLNHYSWGVFLSYRWPSALFIAYFFSLTFLALRMYWIEYRKSDRNTAKHHRTKAFLVAFGIGYLGALDFLPALGIPYYPMSSVPMVCMLILASRAIWRYRLEDITPAFAAREIIDTMNDGLIVLDHRAVVRVVNRATVHPAGLPGRGCCGQAASRKYDGKQRVCGEAGGAVQKRHRARPRGALRS